MRTNITKPSMELIQSPPPKKKKTFYVINNQVSFSFTDSTNRCKALHVILNRSDVGALDQLLGNFSDIGAHQYLQTPNFVMPELNKRTMSVFCLFYSQHPCSMRRTHRVVSKILSELETLVKLISDLGLFESKERFKRYDAQFEK